MAHVRTMNVNHPLSADMMNNKAVARLIAQKEELESELVEMTSSPLVDWDGVKLVKRKKLQVNEQLEDLKRQLQ